MKSLLIAFALVAAAQAASVSNDNIFDDVNPQIVGGVEAKSHSFPWQAGIFVTLPNGRAFCGGSLIHPKWIATAGHCVYGALGFEVILGAHDVNAVEASQQRFPVETALLHEGYNPHTIVNDIALIELPFEAEINDYVQVVSLPASSQKKEKFYKQVATMSGWGLDSDESETIATKLRYVQSTVVSNAYCALRYISPLMWWRGTNICVDGSGGKGTCSGDSGGPLVIKDSNDKATLIGITSFGISLGCEKGWPPAFTRVTSYMDWISEKTGLSFDG